MTHDSNSLRNLNKSRVIKVTNYQFPLRLLKVINATKDYSYYKTHSMVFLNYE